MKNAVKILPLADCKAHIPTLADWFTAKWQPYYGAGGPGDARGDLAACCNRDALPMALVALVGEAELAGTAALKTESVGSDQAPGPWLSAFLVHRNFRRQGIGDRLVGAIEFHAARLGHEAIYVSTDAAEGIFKRRGWARIGAARSLRGEVALYRLKLGDRKA